MFTVNKKQFVEDSRNARDFFKSNTPEFFEMEITPKQAAAIFALTAGNRKERKDKIRLFADDMRNGKWDKTIGEPIGFDTEGHLRDGHHRIKAVETLPEGSHIALIFAIGLSEERLQKIDQGTERTARDFYDMNFGETGKYANFFKNILLLREKNTSPTNSGARFRDFSRDAFAKIMNEEGTAAIEIFNKWKEIISNPYIIRGVSVAEPAILASIIYFLVTDCHQDETLVFNFFRKIMSSDRLENDKNLEFLRYTIQESKIKDVTRVKLEPQMFFKLVMLTYLKHTGYIKRRDYAVYPKAVNHIPDWLNKEEKLKPNDIKEILNKSLSREAS